MNVFKSLGVLLLLSVLVSAYCDYEDNFNITEVNLNTIYPELGEDVEISIFIQSEEFTTSRLRVYLDEGYFTQLLIEENIYISKGENVYNYKVKVPETMPHNVGFLDIEIGNSVESKPLIVENKYTELILENENEENYTLTFESEDNVRFKIDGGITREVLVRQVNGTINLNVKKCNDCEIIVSFEYMDEEFKIYKKWGEYVKPYVRISKVDNKKVEFVSCPPREIENYEYSNGYEKFKVENVDFDLERFYTEEKNEIQILNTQPLVVLVKASDELNRNVKSKGELMLQCDINNFMNEVEFTGEREFTIDLGVNATCNVSYGNAMVNTQVFKKEKVESEEREEIIYWDDYITYGLVLITIVIMVVLFNRWRVINRKKW